MSVISQPASICVDKILVATDFSKASEKALAYAKALALRFNSTLELAHIIDPKTVTTYEEAILGYPPDHRRQAHRLELERLHYAVSEQGIASKRTAIESEHPAQALLDLAREHEISLIVAGTQSKSDWEKLVLGSTAEAVIRKADCPVLTVGPKAALPPEGPLSFRSIIYATDFSAAASRAAIFAVSFAEDSRSKLYCCCVIDDDARNLENQAVIEAQFKEDLRRIIPEDAYDWCSPECVVEHGDAAERILALARKVKADLIVLGARKSSFWLDHVERGLTPQLLAEAHCPVMTIC